MFEIPPMTFMKTFDLEMQEKVEIITNHIVHFWTILDKNTQKRILWFVGFRLLSLNLPAY